MELVSNRESSNRRVWRGCLSPPHVANITEIWEVWNFIIMNERVDEE